MKSESESHSVVSDSIQPLGNLQARILADSLSLLQRISPTQESNSGLPHCRRILYQLNHKGSPRILKWVAYPLLQWIFSTQESNQGLLHCRQILYQLSYQGSPSYSPSKCDVWMKTTAYVITFLGASVEKTLSG